MFVIRPEDVEREILDQGIDSSKLNVPPVSFLTFNKAILDEFPQKCGLKEWDWPLVRFSPYATLYAKCWKGKIDGMDIAVFYPPMGASPLAAFCEELIYFGSKLIFLLCASWSLGREYLGEGQIHLPSFAVGKDGTSPHYGNIDGRVNAEPKVLELLTKTLNDLDADWKEGGVGSCEAFYRITPDLIEKFSKQGCLSMENGEVATLFALGKESNIPVGILLQPYIDLKKGWQLSYFGDEYKQTCSLQANAAIEAAKRLLR